MSRKTAKKRGRTFTRGILSCTNEHDLPSPDDGRSGVRRASARALGLRRVSPQRLQRLREVERGDAGRGGHRVRPVSREAAEGPELAEWLRGYAVAPSKT